MQNTCEHCCTKIENLNVSFGKTSVLQGVNLHLNCREILAIIGPNGAGKTTLLRAVIGEIPFAGKISFLVKASPGRAPRIGYVPQKINFDLDSPVSVLDLVATTITHNPIWLGIKKCVREEAVNILKKVASEKLIDKRIGELSGGELQRVLLSMAMTPIPDLLLLDEPISAVDLKGVSLFYEIVSSLKKQFDISIIMVTHNLTGVVPYADRMILLDRTIVAEGTAKEVLADKKMLEAFQMSL